MTFIVFNIYNFKLFEFKKNKSLIFLFSNKNYNNDDNR